MRQLAAFIAQIDWPRLIRSKWVYIPLTLAVAAILMLAAVHPFTFGAIPDSPDGLLHFYRLIALDHSLQHGDIWPRYAPGLLFGYGAPVFNYYAPLSLYLFEVLHLTGFRFLDAYLIGLIVYALLGALGAYKLGQVWLVGDKANTWEGVAAGLVTATAYAYAPYTLYNSPRRGAVAEFLALAVLPWVLWAFWRLAAYGRRRDFLLATALYAVFIPIHNITTLQGTVLLMVTSLILWWVNDDPRRALAQLLLAGALALGLTTFFWLPALAEAGYAQLENAIGPASADFHNNFQSLGETFALPMAADLTQIHPPVPRPLGWPQILLAVAGLVLLWWPGLRSNDRRGMLRHWLGLSVVGVILLLFLTTPASTFIWETLPLLHFTQLPWRLLGLASLLLAVLAGAGVLLVGRLIDSPRWRAAWIGGSLLVIILYAMPWMYGLYLPEPRAESIVDVQNFERETGWLATGSLREYLPHWTSELPDPDRLTGLYAQSELIPRLQPTAGVTVNEAAWGLHDAVLDVSLKEETVLVFDWLYFPGWLAFLDGTEAAVMPTGPQGYIGVEVPGGDHHLELLFGPTRLRLGAMIASGVFALAGVVTLFVRPLWPHSPNTRLEQAAKAISPDAWRGVWMALAAAALAGLLIFGMKIFLVDNTNTPIKRARFAGGTAAGLQTPVEVNFGGQVRLLGFDLPKETVRSNRAAELTLYWQSTVDEIEEDYSSVVYLRDVNGSVVMQTGSQHPGDWPTSDWLPGFYIQGRLTLEIPPATPPGLYTVHVALYSHTEQRNIDVTDADNNPLGVTVEIATLRIRRPARRPSPAGLGLDSPLDARLTDALTLIDVSSMPEEAAVGQSFPLIWYWRARSRPRETFQAQVLWLDGEDIAAASPPIDLAAGYPTEQWRRGDLWKGIHILYVPGRLESGEYTTAIQVVDGEGEPVGEQAVLGDMLVTTPPRSFELPEAAYTAEAEWANGIKLAGYDLSEEQIRQGEALDLTLYWQTDSDIASSLTVFLHLLNEEGNIVAQRDQIPAAGSRPTTGWAPGEVVGDAYTLFIDESIPPGEYRLRIGLYNARSGARIAMPDGAGSWLLPLSVIVQGE